MPDIMAMVKANICRALPPNNEDFDPEEDEPILESSWPHLQVGRRTRGKRRAGAAGGQSTRSKGRTPFLGPLGVALGLWSRPHVV